MRPKPKSRVASPNVLANREALQGYIRAMARAICGSLQSGGLIKAQLEDAEKFVYIFWSMGFREKKGTTDTKELKELLEDCNVGESDAIVIAVALLGPAQLAKGGAAEARLLGKRLLFGMSAVGSVPAMLRILNQALLQHQKGSAVLKSAEITRERAHLRTLADKKDDFRAVALQGHVAHALGDEEQAIAYLTAAVPLAVKADEQKRQSRKSTGWGTPPSKAFDPMINLNNLETPWLELFLIHAERTARGLDEREAAVQAMQVGLDQDDPNMFYHSAESFARQWSSEWFHDMTKAAASMHPKAMHKLGEFYLQSRWKYIKDEPPDHVKPTPFDSYPAPRGLERSKSTDTRRQGIEDCFHAAIWPSTTKERVMLGLEWLNLAIDLTYVPALLTAAELHLRRELPNLDAPKEAIELSRSRYAFPTKENYLHEATVMGHLDRHAGEPVPSAYARGRLEDHSDLVGSPSTVPNPFYSEEKAYEYLRQVFVAYNADRLYEHYVRSGDDKVPEHTFQDQLIADVADIDPELARYLKQATVREQYEDEILDLADRAAKLSVKFDWEMRLKNGRLLWATPTEETMEKERRKTQSRRSKKPSFLGQG